MLQRKTKIITTLGPATDSINNIKKLIEVGTNVFRINMSHSQHDWVREVVKKIRDCSNSLNYEVGILIDLQGPSIRTGDVDKPINLKRGYTVEFRNSNLDPTHDISVTSNYDDLYKDVSVSDLLLVDNGEIHFTVTEVLEGRVICEVKTEGYMKSRRHINLPGIKIGLPGLTEKDILDLNLVSEIEVDYVAISFVRDPEHIKNVRETLLNNDQLCCPQIISKIEDQEAVKKISEIIKESDAVMVARGDLGIEVHIEELPAIQRHIMKEASRIGRQVIVATHMMESMIDNPVPTRAEVTDVANAIYEEADAVMLSGETSVGSYPIETVETLNKIVRRMEKEPTALFSSNINLNTDLDYVIKSAISLANSFNSSKIIVMCEDGKLSRQIACHKPVNSEIFSFCSNLTDVRRLSLSRSVYPFLKTFKGSSEENIVSAKDFLIARKYITTGIPLIILGSNMNNNLNQSESIIFIRS